MPTSPGSICRMCSLRAIDGRKYCSVHATHADDETTANHHWSEYRKDDPVRKLYKTARWKNTRMVVLRTSPLCQMCGHRASKVADHHPITARQIVATLGTSAFYDPTRCQALCVECHDSKPEGT